MVKSFDTVDRDILDSALGRLGLPAWFRKVCFSFHRDARLRFKLAAGLGVALVFIVSLYAPWCWHLESLKGISPQLYADNLKCTSFYVAARYTVSYVEVVGQEASPSKCVLLSTSKAARRRMTAWRNENEGCFWAVKLDVRDLGGHLDVTLRAVAGTLRGGVSWGFNACLGWCALEGFMVVKVLPSLSTHLVQCCGCACGLVSEASYDQHSCTF